MPTDPLSRLRPEYRRLYDLICAGLSRTGRAPSQREMQRHLNVTRAWVQRMLAVLHAAGLIRWTRGRHRAIAVCRANDVRPVVSLADGLVELRWGAEVLRLTVEDWRALHAEVERLAAADWFGKAG